MRLPALAATEAALAAAIPAFPRGAPLPLGGAALVVTGGASSPAEAKGDISSSSPEAEGDGPGVGAGSGATPREAGTYLARGFSAAGASEGAEVAEGEGAGEAGGGEDRGAAGAPTRGKQAGW